MVGLTQAEAEKLQKTHGRNMLESKKRSSVMKIFCNQFKDFMVLILLVATGVLVAIGEISDAVTIIIIVLMDAILGFVQEYRTEKTLETLKKLSSPTAKVYRDGILQTIPSENLVVGDVVELDTGDRIPADCNVLQCVGLYCDESILTGESLPVAKKVGNSHNLDNSLNLDTVVYSGTSVSKGHGKVSVMAIGKATQMGRISKMLADIPEEETPLQHRLRELSKTVAMLCIIVCVVVFLAGVLRGEPTFQMLMTAITIAIASIPEGLPATVTISLALAVGRMLKSQALVNRLHSVETLGCTSVICTDKTGTITQNKMSVKVIVCEGEEYQTLERLDVEKSRALKELVMCAILCNNATPTGGDPTEVALLELSKRCNVPLESLKIKYPRLDEIPFDSQTKYMSVTVRNPQGETLVYSKGSIESILKMCTHVHIHGVERPLNTELKSQWANSAERLSKQAMRVLAFCVRIENRTILLGLCGMEDPPRPEAKRAVEECKSAHVKTVMITGDHKATACAIAKQVGILRGKKAITGDELDKLSDDELLHTLDDYSVFARVNPSHKLRLVRLYKRKGNVVTMTGDGVNDAPAIKEADVGVSMGISGTDVAKNSADVILLDDNFATLVNAVRQGRCIYANIRKFVRYLLACNIGEVLTMFIGILLGLPIVLLPSQLLLVNLITDGLPAVTLSLEPPEKSSMKRPPRTKDESFFSHGLMEKILIRGVLIGFVTLGAFMVVSSMGGDLATCRTCALVTLIVSQLVHVFECKSEDGTLFSIEYFNNPKLILAVIFSLAVTLMSVYFPPLMKVFSTVSLNRELMLISLGFAIVPSVLAMLVPKSKG
jgi:Ca2+-transporting ATPase